jgi:toxin YoeB
VEVVFLPDAKADLKFWAKSGNKAILKRITQLIESILLSPFSGIGKPEALKHGLHGLWSRRINSEHRIIYEVKDTELLIYSVRGHYNL